MSKNILIVGNGAAGLAAAEAIKKEQHVAHVTMISSENQMPYYRPMLSEMVYSKDIPKKFYLHTDEWYQENGVDVILNTSIQHIDAKNKQAFSTNNTAFAYDRLILCTGSTNQLPPISGISFPHVTSIRTYEDVLALQRLIPKVKSAIIIGGGLLGLEAGWQLTKCGIQVHVLEMQDRLLPRQLDLEASDIFEDRVLATGMTIYKNAICKAIHPRHIELDSGEIINAELVIVSIGIKPNVDLARSLGIDLHKGILVNDQMKTSIDGIYACGDCAEHKGMNYAIWPEAVAQGKVAGINALGGNATYTPIVPFHIYHGMNMKLFSMGDVGTDPHKTYTFHTIIQSDHFEKYIFNNDILVGGILIDSMAKVATIKQAINDKSSKSHFLMNL